MSERNYMEVYEQWVNNPLFGQETKDELLSIKDDPKEIEERFYCDLVFGTAGLRGYVLQQMESRHTDSSLYVRHRSCHLQFAIWTV